MALRALQGPAGGSAPVGGSGTSSPSTIPRWTGPSTLGDSAMVQSAAAITVSLPQFALGATGSGTGGGYRVIDDTGTSRFLMGFVGVAGAKDWSLYDLANSAYRVVVVGTGAGAGNVGIGTASPAARLQVNDTSTTSTTRNIYTGAITAGLGGSIGLGGYWNGTTETMFAYIVGGKDNATNGDYGGHLQFWTRPNGGVYTERARIDSSGNLLVRQRSNAANNAVAFDNTVQNALTVDSGGNIYGTSGTTGMTNGFFYIPAAAGAPTGTPTAVSGRVPMYYDTTNNQFYVYNGAWKKVTLA